MSLRDNILAYLKDEVLRGAGITDVSEVTDFEDEKFSDGYCESCYYEYYRLVIRYNDNEGKAQRYVHYDTLAELLRY